MYGRTKYSSGSRFIDRTRDSAHDGQAIGD